MMPKTEVVKNEDMQNLLQNIGQVKTEPVVDIGVFQPDEQTSNKRNVDGTERLDNIPTELSSVVAASERKE